MDAPLLDASVEEQSASAPAPQGFTVPAVQGFERSNSLIDTGLMATLLRIRLPKLDATVEVKNKRVVIVAALGLLERRLQRIALRLERRELLVLRGRRVAAQRRGGTR